ncbi:MAG: ArsR family transcriptional regulator [Euryarchaeota archaeon]|nr:ArsR family transcriptional regulator [Euryarchaeota archaeon]
MNRIKVINEPADLVAILRAVDTDIKREVLKEISIGWRSPKEIDAKFGAEGKKALQLFDKMKLVETRWQPTDGAPDKTYHTYYSSFHINASCPIYEISDVLAATVLPEARYKKLEEKIFKMVGEEGRFAGDIADELKVSQTMLKSLIKRSSRLDYRGHRVERLKEE